MTFVHHIQKEDDEHRPRCGHREARYTRMLNLAQIEEELNRELGPTECKKKVCLNCLSAVKLRDVYYPKRSYEEYLKEERELRARKIAAIEAVLERSTDTNIPNTIAEAILEALQNA